MIEKNSPLPATFTADDFVTQAPGQTSLRCTVTQSAALEKDPNFVKIIWEGRLGNLPPDRPSGQVIEVTFDYDLNQVMHCSFKDVSSGKLVEIDLNEKHGISSESTESKMKDNIDEFLIE